MLAALSACNPTAEPGPEAGTLPDWYYTGGQLGTTYLSTSQAYEQPTPAVEQAGMTLAFKRGEQLFEKPFMANHEGVRRGLGPVYIRTSCMHCHPGYGHGRQRLRALAGRDAAGARRSPLPGSAR